MKDNFDFYDEEEKRLAKAEKEQPHCDWCGEAMWEYYFKIGEDKVCDRCIEEAREWI